MLYEGEIFKKRGVQEGVFFFPGPGRPKGQFDATPTSLRSKMTLEENDFRLKYA
jgi:hypothetical protein